MQYIFILLKLKKITKTTSCKIENVKKNSTFEESSLDVACSFLVLEPLSHWHVIVFWCIRQQTGTTVSEMLLTDWMLCSSWDRLTWSFGGSAEFADVCRFGHGTHGGFQKLSTVKQSNAKSILSLGSSWGWNNRPVDIRLCWGTSWALGWQQNI